MALQVDTLNTNIAALVVAVDAAVAAGIGTDPNAQAAVDAAAAAVKVASDKLTAATPTV